MKDSSYFAIPDVPEALKTDPSMVRLAFYLKAVGVQVYECSKGPDGNGKWVLREPIADLYDDDGQIVCTHGKGPHWKSVVAGDNSKVTGVLKDGKPKGKADSPDADAIPWLLIDAAGEGEGMFAKVTQIQRLETQGGKAPQTTCDASDSSAEVRVPYQATYYFYVPVY